MKYMLFNIMALAALSAVLFTQNVNAQCNTSSVPVTSGIIDLGNGTVSYWWEPIFGTEAYQLEINTSDGNTIVLQGAGNEPISAYYSGYVNGTYTWRVRLACSRTPLVTTQWSPLDTFDVVLSPTCDASSAPMHAHETFLSNAVNLHWHPFKNAKGCVFEMNGTSTSFTLDKLLRGNSLTNLTIPFTMLDGAGTCYEWRVQCGCSPADLSPFTTYKTFCVPGPRLAADEEITTWSVWSSDGRLILEDMGRINDIGSYSNLPSGLYIFTGSTSTGQVVKSEYKFIN